MEKIVDFSIIKSKIIKTDELFKLYATKTTDLERMHSFHTQLKKKFEQSKLEIQKLQLKNETIDYQSKTSETNLNALKTEHENLKSQFESLERNSNETINNLQLKYQHVSQEVADQQELLQKQVKKPVTEKPARGKKKGVRDNADTVKKVQDLTLEKELIAEENDSLKLELTKLKEKVLACEKLEDSTVQLKQAESELIIKQREIAELKIKFRKSQGEHSSEVAKLKDEMKLLQLRVEAPGPENEQLRKDNCALQLEVTACKEKIRTVGEVNTCMIQENRKVNQLLDNYKKEVYELKEKLRDCNKTPSDDQVFDILKETVLPERVMPFSETSDESFDLEENSQKRDEYYNARKRHHNNRRAISKQRMMKRGNQNVNILGALLELKKHNIKFTISNQTIGPTTNNITGILPKRLMPNRHCDLDCDNMEIKKTRFANRNNHVVENDFETNGPKISECIQATNPQNQNNRQRLNNIQRLQISEDSINNQQKITTRRLTSDDKISNGDQNLRNKDTDSNHQKISRRRLTNEESDVNMDHQQPANKDKGCMQQKISRRRQASEDNDVIMDQQPENKDKAHNQQKQSSQSLTSEDSGVSFDFDQHPSNQDKGFNQQTTSKRRLTSDDSDVSIDQPSANKEKQKVNKRAVKRKIKGSEKQSQILRRLRSAAKVSINKGTQQKTRRRIRSEEDSPDEDAAKDEQTTRLSESEDTKNQSTELSPNIQPAEVPDKSSFILKTLVGSDLSPPAKKRVAHNLKPVKEEKNVFKRPVCRTRQSPRLHRPVEPEAPESLTVFDLSQSIRAMLRESPGSPTPSDDENDCEIEPRAIPLEKVVSLAPMTIPLERVKCEEVKPWMKGVMPLEKVECREVKPLNGTVKEVKPMIIPLERVQCRRVEPMIIPFEPRTMPLGDVDYGAVGSISMPLGNVDCGTVRPMVDYGDLEFSDGEGFKGFEDSEMSLEVCKGVEKISSEFSDEGEFEEFEDKVSPKVFQRVEEMSPEFLDEGVEDEAPLKVCKRVEKMPPSKIKVLFEKLMNFSKEEKHLEEIVQQFADQEPHYIASAVLEMVSQDIHDTADTKYLPAPLMTLTQRTLLGFMSKLEKSNMQGVFEHFLKLSEHRLLTSPKLLEINPITRLYLAICKLQQNLHRMRQFCCDVFYFCGDLAVPFFFTVLTSWIEVLPVAMKAENEPLARVLVQAVYMKDCNTPGYNLLPLRDLLIKYYGYPSERWDSNVIFKELYINYLNTAGSKSSDYALLLFCKNHPDKWVNEKIETLFKPLVEKVPNENFKALVIIFVGNLSSRFSAKAEVNYLIGIRAWLRSLNTETASEVVRNSIHLCLTRLKKK